MLVLNYILMLYVATQTYLYLQQLIILSFSYVRPTLYIFIPCKRGVGSMVDLCSMQYVPIPTVYLLLCVCIIITSAQLISSYVQVGLGTQLWSVMCIRVNTMLRICNKTKKKVHRCTLRVHYTHACIVTSLESDFHRAFFFFRIINIYYNIYIPIPTQASLHGYGYGYGYCRKIDYTYIKVVLLLLF